MIKPRKERLQIYGWVLVCTTIVTVALLVTGYDYRRKGFFMADSREPMTFWESLTVFPGEFVYILPAVVAIFALVELVIFVCQRVFRRS